MGRENSKKKVKGGPKGVDDSPNTHEHQIKDNPRSEGGFKSAGFSHTTINTNNTSSSSSSSSNKKTGLEMYPEAIRNFLRYYVATGDGSETLTSGSSQTIQIKKETLDKLRSEYVSLVAANESNSNKSDSTRDSVDKEMIELEEIRKSYSAVEHKYQALTTLSSELSRRLSELETSAQSDLKLERERRLHMSKSFSTTINGISAKLDALNKRREVVINENNELRIKLKQCLEEFDELEAQDKLATDKGDAAPNAEGNKIAEETDQKSSEKEKEDTDGEEESERMQMSIEDDARTILRLSAQEKTLRQTSLQYMQTFGQFQSRLQASNEIFTVKQNYLESCAAEIGSLEKKNKELSAKAIECAASAKALRARSSSQPLHIERERLLRATERYRGLIATFQADIDAMQALKSASSADNIVSS